MRPTGGYRRRRAVAGDAPGLHLPGGVLGPLEAGASLVIALVFILIFTVTAAALLQQGFTSQRTAVALQQIRRQDAAGDGAVKVMINRLTGLYNSSPNPTTNPAYIVANQGRDGLLFTDPACVFNMQSTLTDATGTRLKITATCKADDGSNSGALPSGPLPTDTPQQPRTMTIDACLRNQSVVDTDLHMCGSVAGDEMIVQARVRFDVTVDSPNGYTTGTVGAPTANLPEVLEWNHMLLSGNP